MGLMEIRASGVNERNHGAPCFRSSQIREILLLRSIHSVGSPQFRRGKGPNATWEVEQ